MNSYIILFLIAAYFGILLLIAWITGRKSTGNEAFFPGTETNVTPEREVPTIPIDTI